MGGQADCGAISTVDGRWRAVQCSNSLPTACRGVGGEWQLATGVRGSCPPGYAWEVPHHAKENMQLQSLLKMNAGPPVEAAWLPVAGHWQLSSVCVSGNSVALDCGTMWSACGVTCDLAISLQSFTCDMKCAYGCNASDCPPGVNRALCVPVFADK